MGATERPVSIEVESALEQPNTLAPPEYRPTLESWTMVHDDELLDLPPMMGWRMFFAEGSNRNHWVRTDQEAQPHFVESLSLDGGYEAHGPGYGEQYDNAHDAFRKADLMCRANSQSPETEV